MSTISRSRASAFAGRRAFLVYGFEDPPRPLRWLIKAFEAVAARTTALRPREEAPLRGLLHPTFAAGRVYAWTRRHHPDRAGDAGLVTAEGRCHTVKQANA